MALIKCSECGKEVSDKASACPNCGAPIIIETSNKKCPKCESSNVFINREQRGTLGASTNKVVVVNRKSHGCLYWLCCGWIISILYWLCIGWWWGLLFGKKKSGLNFHASKTLNKTVAICQDCGHTWTVKN